MSSPTTTTTTDLHSRLKSTLWHTLGTLIDDAALAQNLNASHGFIAALTELVWAQLEAVARDLECFAKHANRSTITTDDVLLLVRRNEELEGLLREFVEREKEKAGRGEGDVLGGGGGGVVAGKRKR